MSAAPPITHPPMNDDAGSRRRRRVWPWVLGGVAVLVALAGGLAIAGLALSAQASEVREELGAARSGLNEVVDLAVDGETEEAEAVAAEVIASTAHAQEIVQNPLWSAASVVPFVGQNVAAVKATTEAVHILMRDALPASLDLLAMTDTGNFRIESGGFDLEPFRAALDRLPQVNEALAGAQLAVAGIDRDALLDFVDDAIGEVLDAIDTAAPLLQTAEDVLPTLLQIAGESEPRTYLLVFQNNAEIRATGGNPAASMSVHVDDGHMYLGAQAGSGTFAEEGLTGWSFADVDPAALALYDGEFTMYSQNFTRTPDFPTTAALFAGLWMEAEDEQLDGIISVDPIVLAHMLEVTGPIRLDDGEEEYDLGSEDVVDFLLRDVYDEFPLDGDASDAVFAEVAALSFWKLVQGSWDPLDMFGELSDMRDEQRLYAWFPRAEEQEMARQLGVDGALATDSAQATEVGVFLNDSGVSKLEYFLSTEVAVDCAPAERTITTTLTLRSDVPDYHLGYYTMSLRNERYGMASSSMLLDVLMFPPPGGEVLSSSPQTGDLPQMDREGVENGRSARSLTVELPRGETKTVSFTSSLADGPVGPLSVRYSPTVTDTPVEIAASCTELMSDG